MLEEWGVVEAEETAFPLWGGGGGGMDRVDKRRHSALWLAELIDLWARDTAREGKDTRKAGSTPPTSQMA